MCGFTRVNVLFNVANLLKASSGKKQLDSVNEKFGSFLYPATGLVVGTVLMMRTDVGVWVSAKLKASINLQCVRCLEEFDEIIPLDIEEEYVPYIDLMSKKIIDIEESEGSYRIGNDNLINLNRAVLEYSELSSPLNPKCKEECMGICVECGFNKNDNKCDCEFDTRDPRWAPLSKLVKALE